MISAILSHEALTIELFAVHAKRFSIAEQYSEQNSKKKKGE